MTTYQSTSSVLTGENACPDCGSADLQRKGTTTFLCMSCGRWSSRSVIDHQQLLEQHAQFDAEVRRLRDEGYVQRDIAAQLARRSAGCRTPGSGWKAKTVASPRLHRHHYAVEDAPSVPGRRRG